MPSQTETPEIELADLIATVKVLARQLRASIHQARDLRRAAAERESRSKNAVFQSECDPDQVNQEVAELRAKGRESNEPASQ